MENLKLALKISSRKEIKKSLEKELKNIELSASRNIPTVIGIQKLSYLRSELAECNSEIEEMSKQLIDSGNSELLELSNSELLSKVSKLPD